jgi:hypothetical protein
VTRRASKPAKLRPETLKMRFFTVGAVQAEMYA